MVSDWAERVLIASHDAVVGVDRDGRIAFANEAAARLFGHDPGTLEHQALDVLLPLPAIQAHRQHVTDFIDSATQGRTMRRSREVVGRRSDGSLIPMLGSICPVTDGPVAAVAVLTDMTSYQAAHATSRHLELALSMSGVGFVGFDVSHRVVFVNEVFAATWGTSVEWMTGRPLNEIAESLSVVARSAAEGVEAELTWSSVTSFEVGGRRRWYDAFAAMSRPPGADPVVVLCLRDATERQLAARRAQSSALTLYLAQELSGVGTWAWSSDQPAVVQISPTLGCLLNRPSGEYSLLGALHLVHREDRLDLLRRIRRTAGSGEGIRMQHRLVRADNAPCFVTHASSNDADSDGGCRILGVVRDDTDVLKSLFEARQSKQLLEAAINSLSALSAIVDRRGTIVATNRSWKVFATERNATSECGMGVNYLTIAARAAEEGVPGASDALRAVGSVLCGAVATASHDYEFVESDGSVRWFMLTVEAIDGLGGAVISHRDITARKRAEQELREQAMHDPLTGIANRAAIRSMLDAACGKELDVLIAVIDLDDFKLVNDSLGHEAGDRVIVAVAERLRSTLRMTDGVGRLGGDEFVVVCPGIGTVEQAAELASRISDAMAPPILVEGNHVEIRASVGFAIGHSSAARRQPDQLLKQADAAMYAVKRGGGNSFHVFSPGDVDQTGSRLRLEENLRRDLVAGRLRVHFQPLFAISDRRIASFEALARWTHPEHGVVPASTFVAVAESSGLISMLGSHVLGTACRQLVEWDRRGLTGTEHVAVNISLRELASDEIVETVLRVLRDTKLDPSRLEIEVTETAFAGDDTSYHGNIRKLVAKGVRVAIDDFGAGCTSLAQLKCLPISTLKIDRRFIVELDSDPRDQAIVRGLTSIGRSLGLTVVVEGIEREGQLQAARELGCDVAQGFLLSPPLEPARCEELLRRTVMMAN